MAEGKNIPIKITATGGEQAAREIEKVADAAEKVQETRGFGGMLDGTVPRTDEAAEAFENAAESAEKLTDALPDLTDGDLAAEAMERIQGSTAAAGAEAAASTGRFAGLGRTLLAFAGGPIGVLTTAVGLIAAVFKRWYDRIQELNQSLQKQEEIALQGARSIREMNEADEQSARLKAEAAARGEELANVIARITDAQTPYNEALEKEIGLLKQKQAAENAIAQARGQTEIERAEGDPVRQEEIRQSLRREQQQRELRQIEEERRKRQELLDRREADLPRVQEQGSATIADLEARAREARRLARDQREIEILANTRAKQQQAILDANAGLGNVREIEAFGTAAAEKSVSRRAADEAAKEAKRLEAEATALAQAASEAKNKVQSDTQAIAASMQKLYDEIRRLELERETKTQVFAEADVQGDIRLERTRQQEKERQEREQQKAAREAERQRLEAERDAARGGLNQDARTAGLDLRRRGLAADNETAAAVGRALQDGTNSAELQKLGDMVRERIGQNTAAQTQYLLRILEALEAQARKQEQLEQRLRNLPK